MKIKDLGLSLEGSRLELLVQQFYGELDARGLKFKPRLCLSEEWGCPNNVPVIGVPFYLVRDDLRALEREIMGGVEAETDEEILRYLRHEAGHTFNYAYKLYETEEWHELFGPYSRPYNDEYKPNPFSRSFVRHLPGWYAQKHPDEDFAETFAVWLDPNSDWRVEYKEWACFPKLLYMERIANELGQQPPTISGDSYVEELDDSIEEHYFKFRPRAFEIPAYFDGDLREIFEDAGEIAASDFISEHRRQIVDTIHFWTGVGDIVVFSLVEHFIQRCNALGLRLERESGAEILTKLMVYTTTLSMNKLYKGDFIIREDRKT